MQDIDAVLEVLRLARAEGALEGDGLEAFARGLRERADLVIEERVTRAEAQVRRLEQEVTWRRETNEGLEQTNAALERETAWRRETNQGLEQTNAALERVVASLRAEVATSAEAHDRLLSHHRDVLGRVAAELSAVAVLPFYSLRSARRRLVSLAAAIRGESA
jgi:uncharacterized protein (DUF3084 family)